MITVVSGLPRSGTSLMMRMLEAGGLPVLTDDARKPDEHNPHGYYEYAPVKRLKDDSAWLAQAEGKAVKVVSMLLYDLPPDRKYKIVFMKRDMDEILSSQEEMLRQVGSASSPVFNEELKQTFERHLEKLFAWLARQAHVELLFCDYNRLVRAPDEITAGIVRYLETDLNILAMNQAVDKKLYRHQTPVKRTGKQ